MLFTGQHVSSRATRSMFSTVDSLRNGFSSLVRCVGGLISAKITWQDWDHPDPDDVWRSLGVDADLASVLSELQLRFSSGRLRAARFLEHDVSAPRRFTAVLLRLWEFKKLP